MKALILIGLQGDFLAGGPMAVPDGDSIIPLANQLQAAFRLVVATQQWHPANHQSFALNHRGRVAGERVRVARAEQILQPTHCVQNTRGGELSPALMRNHINKVIRLGTDADVDDSSAFFDGDHRHSTGLSEYLHEKRAGPLYLMGLATETAVLATALDARGLGFKTWVIEDGCRARDPNPETARQAFATMEAAGVQRTTSAAIGLRKLRPAPPSAR